MEPALLRTGLMDSKPLQSVIQSDRASNPTEYAADHYSYLVEKFRMVADSKAQTTQEAELARLIVKTLNLEVSADDIDPQESLFGEGLGLDSIDILEVALIVSREFGVKLRADDKSNVEIFNSLRSLNAFIQTHRGS